MPIVKCPSINISLKSLLELEQLSWPIYSLKESRLASGTMTTKFEESILNKFKLACCT